MSTFDPDHELTDQELDAVLGTADSDLLGYVRAITDPSDLLLGLMGRGEGAAQEQGPADHDLRGDTAVAMVVRRCLARTLARDLGPTLDPDRARIHARVHARTLNRDLGRDLARVHVRALDRVGVLDLSHALSRALDRDHDLDLSHALARDLAHGLSHNWDLAHAYDLARYLAVRLNTRRDLNLGLETRLALGLAHTLHRDGTRDLDHVSADAVRLAERLADRITVRLAERLAHARGLAGDLARALEAVAIDVSGVDLSHIKLGPRDVEVLAGVVWTRETRWPPGIAEELTVHSKEIRPGVYQVRRGSERDPLNLGSV